LAISATEPDRTLMDVPGCQAAVFKIVLWESRPHALGGINSSRRG
jgi:hypothetical protein